MLDVSTTFIHVDLVVSDIDKTIEYYNNFLGFQLMEDCQIEGEVVSFLSNGQASKMRLVFLSRNKRSTMIELVQFLTNSGEKITAASSLKLNLSLSFLVPDLDEVISGFKLKGVNPASPVFNIDLKKLGKTKIVFFRDPDDYLIEYVSSC